ncbi:MAG: cytochrome P450 [Myxococcota bacterium]
MPNPDLADFSPHAASFYEGGEADAVFRRLRAEDPLHWSERFGYWAVTKHADIQSMSQRPRLFSSEQGSQLAELVRIAEGRPRPDASRADQLARATLLRMDPPRHNQLRKAVIGAFTPRQVAALEPRIREIARHTLDTVGEGDRIDLVERVAVPLPMIVIAELLGVPPEHGPRFRRWSDAMIAAGAGEFGDETRAASTELIQYVLAIAEERRRRPRGDLISRLVAAEVDGQPLSDLEIGMFGLTLLVAGNETTRNLIAGGSLALLHHPEQHERLLATPGLLPNAIEEMLRFVTPIRHVTRRATADVEVRGRTVRAGDALVFFYGSANRDEEVFGPDAERFDITRSDARRHLSFGFGEHVCLGAALARLEARVLFEELFARWPRFELAETPQPLGSPLVNGLASLPVRRAA